MKKIFITSILMATLLLNACQLVQTSKTENPKVAMTANAIYVNEEHNYQVPYPKDCYYEETGGTHFQQAVGFNPKGVESSDYQALVGVLSIKKQEYLNTLTKHPQISIRSEFHDISINGQPGSKYFFNNSGNNTTFIIYTITANSKTYLITADDEVDEVLVNNFLIK